MEHAHHSKIKEKTIFPSTQEIFNTKFLVKLSWNLLIFFIQQMSNVEEKIVPRSRCNFFLSTSSILANRSFEIAV